MCLSLMFHLFRAQLETNFDENKRDISIDCNSCRKAFGAKSHYWLDELSCTSESNSLGPFYTCKPTQR